MISGDSGLGGILTDAERVVCGTLERARADAVAAGDAALQARVEALLARRDRPRAYDAVRPPSLLPTLEFVRDDVRLRFMSIMMTFGSQCALSLLRVRMEAFYPADDLTRAHVASWQASADPA